MKEWVTVMAAVLLLFGAGTAQAQQGHYLSLFAGATEVEDADIEGGGEFEMDTGFALGAALGWGFDFGRLEGEIAYRQNDLDRISGGGISADADGELSALSLMANAYVDLDIGSPLTPYLGIGAGLAEVSVDDVKVAGFSLGDEDDTVFAYQLAAGASLDMGSQLALDVSYRYFATEDPEFDGVETEYGSHNVQIGLRISF